MNNKNLFRAFLLLTALVACGVARAKTVALWPLEVDSNNIGLRCVVNPANDLSKSSTNFVNTVTDVEWELPPNPDTDRHALVPLNRSAVHELWRGKPNGFLYNDYSGRHLRRDKAFTIEGYMKILELPGTNVNDWACIISAYNTLGPNNEDRNRWTFSLRRAPRRATPAAGSSGDTAPARTPNSTIMRTTRRLTRSLTRGSTSRLPTRLL